MARTSFYLLSCLLWIATCRGAETFLQIGSLKASRTNDFRVTRVERVLPEGGNYGMILVELRWDADPARHKPQIYYEAFTVGLPVGTVGEWQNLRVKVSRRIAAYTNGVWLHWGTNLVPATNFVRILNLQTTDTGAITSADIEFTGGKLHIAR